VARVSILPNKNHKVFSLGGSLLTKYNSDIYCNIFLLNDNDDCIVIVSIDLIWVDENLCSKIYCYVEEVLHINRENILISATHAHSTPQISKNIKDKKQYIIDESYRYKVVENICSAIFSAWNTKQRGYCEIAQSSSNNSINRRKKILDISKLKTGFIRKTVANRPNYKGNVDSIMMLLFAYYYPKTPAGLVINYAAHPVLSRTDVISSDYPGALSNMIIKRYTKDFVCCFLQGFSGNIKPKVVERSYLTAMGVISKAYHFLFDREAFKKNISELEVSKYAQLLLDDIDNSRVVNKFNSLSIYSKKKIIYIHGKGDDLHIQSGKALIIHRIKIIEEFELFSMNSEVFSEYSTWLRGILTKYNIKVMTIGYSGGMCGYLPTNKAIIDGGYEVENAPKLFDSNSFTLGSVERTIKKNISSIYVDETFE